MLNWNFDPLLNHVVQFLGYSPDLQALRTTPVTAKSLFPVSTCAIMAQQNVLPASCRKILDRAGQQKYLQAVTVRSVAAWIAG